MLELYYYTSPNCRKIVIALEELGLPYRIRWVDLAAGDQDQSEFRTVSPAGKVPALVVEEDDGPAFALFESAAILTYLADRTGRLLPPSGSSRYRTLAWLSWQVGSQGPMLGQATHFHSYARRSGIDAPYATERYRTEAQKCYAVMEEHLRVHPWFGPELSIADIALFPWTRTAKGQGVDLSAYPAVEAWSARMAERPSAKVKPTEDSVQGARAGRGYADRESQHHLFGAAFTGRAQKENDR